MHLVLLSLIALLFNAVHGGSEEGLLYAHPAMNQELICNGAIDLELFNLIKWYKNRTPIAYLTNQSVNHINSKYQQRFSVVNGKNLLIYNLTKNDSGSYKCLIDHDNKVSISNIKLIISDLPDPPSKPNILYFSSRSVQITWIPASTNSTDSLEGYKVEMREGKLSEKWVKLGQTETNVSVVLDGTVASIYGLKPYTMYAFRVRTFNNVGVSRPSTPSSPILTIFERPVGKVKDLQVSNITKTTFLVSWKPPFPLTINGPLFGYLLNITPLSNELKYVYKTRSVDTNSISKHPLHIHESSQDLINGSYPVQQFIHKLAAQTFIQVIGLLPFRPYQINISAFNGIYYGPVDTLEVCTSQANPTKSLDNYGIMLNSSSVDGRDLIVSWYALTDVQYLEGILRGYKIVLRKWDGNDNVNNVTKSKFITYFGIVVSPSGIDHIKSSPEYPKVTVLQINGVDVSQSNNYNGRVQFYRFDDFKGIYGTRSFRAIILTQNNASSRPPLYQNKSFCRNQFLQRSKRFGKFDSKLFQWRAKIENLDQLTNYSLSLIAFNDVGDGPETEPIFYSTDVTVPEAPVNLTARSFIDTPSGRGTLLSLLVSWARPISYTGLISEYKVDLFESGRKTLAQNRNRIIDSSQRLVKSFAVVPRREPQSSYTNLHVLISNIQSESDYDIRVAAIVPSSLRPNESLTGTYSQIHHAHTDVGPVMKARDFSAGLAQATLGLEVHDIAKLGLVAGVSISAIFFVLGIIMLFTWKRHFSRQKYSFLPYIMSSPPIPPTCAESTLSTLSRGKACSKLLKNSGISNNVNSGTLLNNQAVNGDLVSQFEQLKMAQTIQNNTLSFKNRRSQKFRLKGKTPRMRSSALPLASPNDNGSYELRASPITTMETISPFLPPTTLELTRDTTSTTHASLVSPLISFIQNSVGRHFHLPSTKNHHDGTRTRPRVANKNERNKGKKLCHRRCRAKQHNSFSNQSLPPLLLCRLSQCGLLGLDYHSQTVDKTNKNQRLDWLAMIENSDYSHIEPVSIKDWSLFNEIMHAHSDQGFSDQFLAICKSAAALHLPENNRISNLSTNRKKNRYANIFAYDPTRVILSNISANTLNLMGNDEKCGDYINANFINGYSHPHAYIATQGPLLSSINDFWRMVWEYKSESLIMITNLVERGKVKCDLYWPPDIGAIEKYDDIMVKHLSTQKRAYYTIRTFSITKFIDSELTTPSHDIINSSPPIDMVDNCQCTSSDAPSRPMTRPSGSAPVAYFAADLRNSFVACNIKNNMAQPENNSLRDSNHHGETASTSINGMALPQSPYKLTRIVTQFHYTQWPDHGVPRFTLPLLSFVRRCGHFRNVVLETRPPDNIDAAIDRISIKDATPSNEKISNNIDPLLSQFTMCHIDGTNLKPNDPSPSLNALSTSVKNSVLKSELPLVVHCSAGVGRTGTFFVIDVMLERMVRDGNIDVFNYLSQIRQQRNYLVQTEEQFIFIHDALTMALGLGITQLNDALLHNMLYKAFKSYERTNIDNECKSRRTGILKSCAITKRDTCVRNNLQFCHYTKTIGWSFSAEALIKTPAKHAKNCVIKMFSSSSTLPRSFWKLDNIDNSTNRNVSHTSPLPHLIFQQKRNNLFNENKTIPDETLWIQADSIISSPNKNTHSTNFHSSFISSYSNALKSCNRSKNRLKISLYPSSDNMTNVNDSKGIIGSQIKPSKFVTPEPSSPILPHDDWRVSLTPKPTLEGSDYINATYLEGFYSQKDFIVTQHPTLDTVQSFWQMVWENNSTEIFLIIFPADPDSEDYLPFWPALESYLSFDSIKVYCLDSKSRNNLDAQSDGLFSLINFSLESDDEDYQLITKMYICNAKLLPQCFEYPTDILCARDLYHQVQGGQATLPCRNLYKFVFAIANVLMRKNKPPLTNLTQNLSPIIVIDKYGGFYAASLCILASAYLQYRLDDNNFDLFQIAYIFNTKRLNLFSTRSDIVTLYTAMNALLFSSNVCNTTCDTSLQTPQTSYPSSQIDTITLNESDKVCTKTANYQDDLNKASALDSINEYPSNITSIKTLGEKISC